MRTMKVFIWIKLAFFIVTNALELRRLSQIGQWKNSHKISKLILKDMNAYFDVKSEVVKQLPNALTIARVAAIPPFAIAYARNKNTLASIIFILASLTDLFDGYLARKLKVTSDFGVFLDPVADKLMVATALTMLVMKIPLWWFSSAVSLIICREIFVSALREWMAQKGKSVTVKVGILSKIKTAMQMISTSLLLASSPGKNLSVLDISTISHIPKPIIFITGLFTFLISVILTVVSGTQYLIVALPYLTNNKNHKNTQSDEDDDSIYDD